ncbi:MAG: hypothetical protein SFY96_12110 [Planctomycetota bacterium]|nr:hypothetical protein [Planctomycetota bacterium]
MSNPPPSSHQASTRDVFRVVLHPSTIAELLASLRTTRLTAAQRTFRRQLGLPVGVAGATDAAGAGSDPIVVMSGHQAELWHPGIFAKVAAVRGIAERVRGMRRDANVARGEAPSVATAWLVVDQDTNDAHALRVPVLQGNQVAAGVWTIEPAPAVETPTGMCGPLGARQALAPIPANIASDVLRTRLEHVRAMLERHQGVASLAEQMTCATRDLLDAVEPLPPALMATRIASTDLFGELVERMAREPAACIRAYNDAARAFPRSGVRPLDEAKLELPLWRVRRGAARQRVLAATLAQTPREELAPRALLMTGLVRLAACDVFVHGIGGGGIGDDDGYDHVTRRWFEAWLGADAAGLAPVVTASATLRLALPGPDAPSEDEIARAAWRAHAARHQPRLVGDSAAQAEHDRLLVGVRSARSAASAKGSSVAQAFAALHAWRRGYVASQAAAIAALDAQATEARSRAAESRVRHDRTWSIALHDSADLTRLAGDVASRVATMR